MVWSGGTNDSTPYCTAQAENIGRRLCVPSKPLDERTVAMVASSEHVTLTCASEWMLGSVQDDAVSYLAVLLMHVDFLESSASLKVQCRDLSRRRAFEPFSYCPSILRRKKTVVVSLVVLLQIQLPAHFDFHDNAVSSLEDYQGRRTVMAILCLYKSKGGSGQRLWTSSC